MPSPKTPNVRGEFFGALSAAIITLPMAIGYGVIAFAPLGKEFFPTAALMGLNAAIIGGFLAALLGGTPAQISGPKAPLTLIVASVVVILVSGSHLSPQLASNPSVVVGLTMVSVLIGGVTQVLFGFFKLGNVVKYVPHPVVAGFMNGIALLLIWKQLPALFGLPAGISLKEILTDAAIVNPVSVLTGLVTVTAIFLSRAFIKRVPSLLFGFLCGTAVYTVIGLVLKSPLQPPAIGILHASIPSPVAFLDVFRLLPGIISPELISDLVVYGVVLGLIGSMESLFSSVVMDSLNSKRHDSNRELVGQGVGNIIASFFGTLFTAASIPRSVANYRAGARNRISGMFCSFLLLIIFLTMAPLIGRIPLSVFSGIIIAVGINLFDRSTIRLMKSLPRPSAYRKDIVITLVVNISVAAITVSANLVTAVIIGMAISTGYFVTKMGTSIVRRQYPGSRVSSNRVRVFDHSQYLKENGDAIRVFELQGPIFFGSADRLSHVIESEIPGIRYCILDMKHVNEIDSTGANILIRLARSVEKRNKWLLISHMNKDNSLWGFLEAIGAAGAIPVENFFVDTDMALEWAEGELLKGFATQGETVQGRVETQDILKGLSTDELEIFKSKLHRMAYAKGEYIIKEGQTACDLFLLTLGEVCVGLSLPSSNRKKRLFTYSAGTIFGEIALLDGKPRSADVWAEDHCEVHRLSQSDFQLLCHDFPHVAAKFLTNVALVLSQRLRVRTDEIRNLEDR